MHFIGGKFNSLHTEDQCQSSSPPPPPPPASMQMTITCGEEPWTIAGGGGGEGGEGGESRDTERIY